MDNRALSALIAGTLLLGGSSRRATRAFERTCQADIARELHRLGHRWRRRLDDLTALTGGVVGIGILLYAHRRPDRAAERVRATPRC